MPVFQQAYRGLKFLKDIRKMNKERSKSYLVERLGNNRGLLHKVAQLLEWKNSEGGPVRGQESLPFEDVTKLIEENLGKPCNQIFENLEKKSYNASIGQVHFGILKGGEPVAVKLQYPDVAQEIEDQLKLIKTALPLTKISSLGKWKIPLNDYQRHFERVFNDEVSYLKEKENILTFSPKLTKYPNVSAPRVFEELCTNNLLVMSRLEGVHLSEAKGLFSQQERHHLGKILLETYLQAFFQGGFVQGDTNYGNFLFRQDEVAFLDFGNIEFFSVDFRQALIRLIYASDKKLESDIEGDLVHLGFDQDKLSHFQKKIPYLLKNLFEPFLCDYAFDLNNWPVQKRIDQILGETKWWFRSAGGVEFFALLKSFVGIISILKELDAKLPWKRIFYQAIQTDKVDLNPPKNLLESSFKAIAKVVKIQVCKEGQVIVDLTLPIDSLPELPSLMDDAVIQKLRSQGIQPEELVADVMREGCHPQKVFSLEDGPKQFQVWIE